MDCGAWRGMRAGGGVVAGVRGGRSVARGEGVCELKKAPTGPTGAAAEIKAVSGPDHFSFTYRTDESRDVHPGLYGYAKL